MMELKRQIQFPDQRSLPGSDLLAMYMDESAARHHHLCPRQVLGIRMGLYGLRTLGLVDEQYQPRYENKDRFLLTIVETDGCGTDGVAVATDCYVGRRTLRVIDYGKMALTLVHIQPGKAVRIVPHPNARRLATAYAPNARSRWHAYLEAYQIIPDTLLMMLSEVTLTQSIAEILSKPSARAICDQCGEEILNEREITRKELVLCRYCAGTGYYRELNGLP
jgi:formylmethanofuran dehydrogenase subunit E